VTNFRHVLRTKAQISVRWPSRWSSHALTGGRRTWPSVQQLQGCGSKEVPYYQESPKRLLVCRNYNARSLTQQRHTRNTNGYPQDTSKLGKCHTNNDTDAITTAPSNPRSLQSLFPSQVRPPLHGKQTQNTLNQTSTPDRAATKTKPNIPTHDARQPPQVSRDTSPPFQSSQANAIERTFFWQIATTFTL
jgi:hypothetical protein